MIKLVATDVDGTLLQDGTHVLHPAYYEAVRILREKGIFFCVCSGRQYHSARCLFAPVADHVYFIAENGTLIRTDDQILLTHAFPPDAYIPLVRDIRQIPDADMVVSGADNSWVDSGEDSFIYHLLRDKYQYQLENVPDLTDVPAGKVLKISAYHAQGDRGLQGLLRSHWKDELQVSTSGVTWVDISLKEAGKGSALAFLQNYLGVKKEETLYFGDNMNDLPAFERAGLAGTVENARKEIREAADFVGGRFEDLGVLRELQRIFGFSIV